MQSLLMPEEKKMSTDIHNFSYRTPRFRADFNLLLHTEGESPLSLAGHCVDISEDGLRATFSKSLEVGSTVTLILPSAESKPLLRISARLTHRDREFHGFTFDFASEKERDCIGEYIASLRCR